MMHSSTLETIHILFSAELQGIGILLDDEPVEAKDPGFNYYHACFIPTVLPEELRDQFFMPAVISIVDLLKQEAVEPIRLSPLKDVKYSHCYVNLDINDEGVWTISLMVKK